MTEVSGVTPPHNVVIAMAGIAKLFAGDIVETGLHLLFVIIAFLNNFAALDIREQEGSTANPLTPSHLRQACLKLQAAGQMFPLNVGRPPNPLM
jgi:hypothetical protein